jgi:hypothetical protein
MEPPVNTFSKVGNSVHTKKSFLALDHVFLIAMNLFDATFANHDMDFYLSTNLLTTSMELEDRQWEQILTSIEKTLKDLFKSNIKEVAVRCLIDGDSVRLSFADPSYHDLQLAEVCIKESLAQKLAHRAG